MTDTEATFGA